MPESAEMTVASDEDIITATLRGDIASFGMIVESPILWRPRISPRRAS